MMGLPAGPLSGKGKDQKPCEARLRASKKKPTLNAKHLFPVDGAMNTSDGPIRYSSSSFWSFGAQLTHIRDR